jgi:hypothetical protein
MEMGSMERMTGKRSGVNREGSKEELLQTRAARSVE